MDGTLDLEPLPGAAAELAVADAFAHACLHSVLPLPGFTVQAVTGPDQPLSLLATLDATRLQHRAQRIAAGAGRAGLDMDWGSHLAHVMATKPNGWLSSHFGLTALECRKLRQLLAVSSVPSQMVVMSPSEVDLPGFEVAVLHSDSGSDSGSDNGAGVGGGQRRHAVDPLSDSLEAVLSTLGLQDYVAEVRRMGVTTPERLLTLTCADLEVLGLDVVEQVTFKRELVVVLRARRRILQRQAASAAAADSGDPADAALLALLDDPKPTRKELARAHAIRTWERVQDLGRRVHGRLCPRLTCAVLWVPIRYLMPAPRVLLPINVMPFETRFKAFVRMTTPGLKPLFGRWVFYIRWCAWFWAMLAFCTMATGHGSLVIPGQPATVVSYSAEPDFQFVVAMGIFVWFWIMGVYGYYVAASVGRVSMWTNAHVCEGAVEAALSLLCAMGAALGFKRAAGYRLFPGMLRHATAASGFLMLCFALLALSSILLITSARLAAKGPRLEGYNLESPPPPPVPVRIDTSSIPAK